MTVEFTEEMLVDVLLNVAKNELNTLVDMFPWRSEE
jgi:hypothetical protein